MLPLLPRSTLFPYTTLFRSVIALGNQFEGAISGCGSNAPRLGVGHNEPTQRIRGKKAFFEEQFVSGREKGRSEEHTSELQSPCNLVCRLLLEQKNESHTRSE